MAVKPKQQQPKGWTVESVEDMLIEAADTLKRLPGDKPRGYISSMPAPVRSVHEACGWEPAKLRQPPPSPQAIDRLDAVLGWMAWLSEDQVRVVWARACGIPWRPICARLGCGRTKAWQIWVTALVMLKMRLNEGGAGVPTHGVTPAARDGMTLGRREGNWTCR